MASTPSMTAILCAGAVLVAGCSGNSNGGSVSFDTTMGSVTNGIYTGPTDSETKSLDCGKSADLYVEVPAVNNGQASIHVTDGDGVVVYDRSFSTTYAADDIPLDGSGGNWELKVSWAQFNGHVITTLSC